MPDKRRALLERAAVPVLGCATHAIELGPLNQFEAFVSGHKSGQSYHRIKLISDYQR